MPKPNVLILMPDQLGTEVLSLYRGHWAADPALPLAATPHLDRLAEESLVLDQNLSTCPVCTPFRAMLQTGRYPQQTGHVINSVRTRHDEVGLADAFAAAGYDTAYFGKWHLHRGAHPELDVPDYVPPGRDRLGWQHWRAYNQHMLYFEGFYHGHDDGNPGENARWNGYETRALTDMAFDHLDGHPGAAGGRPWLMMVSPHPPHDTLQRPPFKQIPPAYAPADCYTGLPEAGAIPVPPDVPGEHAEEFQASMRHYLAMVVAVDQMLGRWMDRLRSDPALDNTLLLFLSDHGNQAFAGGRGPYFFAKKLPTESCIHVPGLLWSPGRVEPGRTDALVTPVDWCPTLCGLAGVAPPPTVAGRDLSGVLLDGKGPNARSEALTMNFGAAYDSLQDGQEWRGLRTRQHHLVRWRDPEAPGGTRHTLYDIVRDPRQRDDLLSADPPPVGLVRSLQARLDAAQAEVGETPGEVPGASDYADWHDDQRFVRRNVNGLLGTPRPHAR